MKTFLYLAKDPDDGVLADLENISSQGQVTVVACLPAFVEAYTFLGYNAITADQFFTLTDMKFDVVIGNPPYQKGKNSNFYVDFIKKAAENTVVGGYVSLVTPNRFILPHTPAAQTLLDNFQVTKFVVDVNDSFPGIGTNIGVFSATRSDTGHSGKCEYALKDGSSFYGNPYEPNIPSKKPTTEGIVEWNVLREHDTYTFTNKRPDHDNFVFVWRQWKSIGGRLLFDAHVGVPDTDKKLDGKYLETENPQAVVDYLRDSTIGSELHSLWGDQMNIWPFLWDYIPTMESFNS